jgi:hypothetical protein
VVGLILQSVCFHFSSAGSSSNGYHNPHSTSVQNKKCTGTTSFTALQLRKVTSWAARIKMISIVFFILK